MNEVYAAVTENTTEQELNSAIVMLQGLEKQYPEMSEYLQGHIQQIDRYKEQLFETYNQPTTNDNIEVEQTVDDDVNVAQNVNKEVTEEY